MAYGINPADIAAIQAVVDDVKAKTDNLPVDPADESLVEAAVAAAHATTNAAVALVKAKTDNLPSDPADESLLEAEIQKGMSWLDFWSDSDDVIDLADSAGNGSPADVNLPDVVVSGLPAGISLVSVVAILKVRAIENTSASGVNAISGAQAIRVKKSTGTWGVDDVPAINLPDNLWTVAASTREAGDVLIGDNDVKGEVDGDATYNLRFEDSLVDYDYLRLNDCIVGLRFYFTTS